MAIDPFTGQETYAPSTLGGEAAIGAVQAAGIDVPLAFRMTENLPGIPTSMGFTMFRGTNTIMRGGFLEGGGLISDKTSRSKFLRERRASKVRMLDPTTGVVGDIQSSHFVGGTRGGFLGRRADKLVAGGEKGGFVKAAKMNNLTARPRAFGRFHSVSVYGNKGYTPYGASKFLGAAPKVSEFFEKRGVTAAEGSPLMGPGLFSFIGAGVKSDRLERRALKGSGLFGGTKRKLDRLDRSIGAISRMNGLSEIGKMGEVLGAPRIGIAEAATLKSADPVTYRKKSLQQIVDDSRPFVKGRRNVLIKDALYDPITKANVGTRGNILASSMAGPGSSYIAGYVRGALGYGEVDGLEGAAKKGAEAATARFASAVDDLGIVSKSMGKVITKENAEEFLAKTAGKSLRKDIGREGLQKLATGKGAKFLAARYAALAIPGLNVIAAISMAADLGKIAGQGIAATINLARDAQKSMKGSISKPLFGMGYNDTEAAATSRSRGVMAIQNSQLNARSALGNEAGMMAAHFG